MHLFDVGASAMSWLWEILNGLWLMICQAIYPCINFAYMLFEKVASVNLFSDEIFQKLTGRIYVIMGIAMLFIFAYNLIIMIVNPEDKKGSGATGKLVKETMISLTIVVLLPTIFNWLHIVQAHILEDDVIGKLILGGAGTNGNVCDSTDYECKCEFNNFAVDLTSYKEQIEIPLPILNLIPIKWNSNRINYLTNICNVYRNLNGSKRGARSIPPTIFSAFYTPSNFNFEECRNYLITGNSSVITSGSEDEQICINYYYDVSVSKYTGNMLPFVYDGYLNAKVADGNDDSMQFHWFLAIIAGGFAAWAFLCYAMEIGVRVAKLGFLELISPIPVMMRVIPESKSGNSLSGMYNKWFKQYTNTFFDVFIRVFIINFSLFAISLVPDVIDALWTSTTSDDGGFFIKTLALVIIILGILKFAQDAPNLFKEFFGGMGGGNFKIRSPKAQFNDNKLAKQAVGYVGGMATGGVSAAMQGRNPVIGAIKNASNTSKSMGNADLTKKGGFTGAFKSGKSQTDKDWTESKFRAVRAKQDAGKDLSTALTETFLGDPMQKFGKWLGNTTDADIQSASANINGDIKLGDDKILKTILAQETKEKANFDNQRDVNLGGTIYKRKDDGTWNDGKKDYTETQMNEALNNYFANEKHNAFVNAIKPDNEFFKEWSNKFFTTLRTEIPKLGQDNFDKIKRELFNKGISVDGIDDLLKQMSSLREEALAGNDFAKQKFTDIKETLGKQSKDINGDKSYYQATSSSEDNSKK